MKYLALDVETTGLDPMTDQVLEIAGVVDDLTQPATKLEDLPTFYAILNHSRLYGSPYALDMQRRLITAIAHRKDRSQILTPGEVLDQFVTFVDAHGLDRQQLLVAGKNVGTFDVPFVREDLFGNDEVKFDYRFLDPTVWFLFPDDVRPPDQRTCLRRAQLDPRHFPEHTAMGDAHGIVALMRHGMQRNTGFTLDTTQ